MIKCIAIDDEPIALSIIRRYCEQRGNVTLETYTSPRQGMLRIREWKPDVVFLDIEMNDVSGMELARRLPASCCLIFTTAYAQYALEGFEVNAVDFLHKPYFYDRFERAMQKAEQWLRMHELLHLSESEGRRLVLKSDYKNVSVPIGRILYIEAVNNYVKVHLSDGTSVLSKIPLHQLEGQLPPEEFLRIHRSFIVARKRVCRFNSTEVILQSGGTRLPVGKKYIGSVQAVLAEENTSQS